MRRPLVVASLLAALIAAPAAADDPVLDDGDRADVAAALAEAFEAQRVCYGYELNVDDNDAGLYAGRWLVTSLGEVDVAYDERCATFVMLYAHVTYTSESSESSDEASWSISSNVPGDEPTTQDLEALGLEAGDLLNDDQSYDALVNAVLALPVIVADHGLAPPVAMETDAPAAPADAAATGTPGSDWWRENGAKVAFLVVVLAASALWLIVTTPTGLRRAKAVLDAMD